MFKKIVSYLIVIMVVFSIIYLIFGEAEAADSNTVSSTIMDKAPPSAVAPSVIINNSDICRHGISGSVTTSVVGISSAVTIEDIDCVRIKLSRALFGMGMKVAGVSTLCQSPIIFDAMAMSNTWCPYYGKIADDAEQAWKDNPQLIPEGSLIRKQIELANKPSKKRPKKDVKSNETDKKPFNMGALAAFLAILLL